jgi:hypothetical protein
MFQDGSEVEARNVIASSDSTRFLVQKTNAVGVVPTSTIGNIVITNHGDGFLEGLEWGAIAGAATIMVFYGVFSEEIELDSGGVIVFGLVGGVVGGAVGGICGVIAGHRYEYQFPARADSPHK